MSKLKEARALIEARENWTQRAYARESQFTFAISPRHPAAKCFCMIGALKRVHDLDEGGSSDAFVRDVDLLCFFNKLSTMEGLFGVNDLCLHSTVIAYYDRAIEGECLVNLRL